MYKTVLFDLDGTLLPMNQDVFVKTYFSCLAETLGMRVFLLTDCMINKEGKDISCYPNGSLTQLNDLIRELRAADPTPY